MALFDMAKRLILSAVRRIEKFWYLKGERDALRLYFSGGKIPWSKGYMIFRERAITKTLSDVMLLERFRDGQTLPVGYGVGIDERCVELPWVVARVPDVGEVLLDAGSALNHNFVLRHRVFEHKTVHVLTLAPEANCFWNRGVSYLFGDLRDIPIGVAFYDAIACVSTLEHVGFDNTTFTRTETDRECHPIDYAAVMREFHRVLKPGGTLFLSVPFGIYGHFGWFQQYDLKLLRSAIEAFGNAIRIKEVFYRYKIEGWNVSDAADCAESQYVHWVSRPPEQWVPPAKAEPDLAAAARAVACVEIVKE
jgi:SAM-dependent methyltransferase